MPGRVHLLTLAVALSLSLAPSLCAQSSLVGREFTFVRISFGPPPGFRGPGSPPWKHDHPKAEENLLRLLASEVGLATSPSSWKILELSDPEILEHPILFLTEPGYWDPDETEIANLRDYLRSGNLLVLDDFRGSSEWERVEQIFTQVLPGQSFEDLTIEDSPFRSFFQLDSAELPTPYEVPGTPVARGIKNEEGELMAVAFFNTDLGDFWEWGDQLGNPEPAQARRCYEIGVNLVVDALQRHR